MRVKDAQLSAFLILAEHRRVTLRVQKELKVCRVKGGIHARLFVLLSLPGSAEACDGARHVALTPCSYISVPATLPPGNVVVKGPWA